jgi:hypothetical protein
VTKVVQLTSWLLFAAGAALISSATGCASEAATRQKENRLVAAGFRAVPAVTSEQQWLIRTLPADKVSIVSRKAKVYVVYPDHAHQMLYVGHDAEYLAYQCKAQDRGLESNAWERGWGDWDE